jgi:hypothetical protein
MAKHSELWRLRPVWIALPAAILSCSTTRATVVPPTETPAPTATPAPTSTCTPVQAKIPSAEGALSDILLQKSDLPAGFIQLEIPDLVTFLKQSEDPAIVALAENLKSGALVLFGSIGESYYGNMILIYSSPDYAAGVFDTFVALAQTGNEEYREQDVPQIGDQTHAWRSESEGETSYLLGWRYHEAVLILQYSGYQDVGIDELVRLAEVVHARLESA